MSKKILSVVLALVFVVSAFAVSAFAVGDTAVDPEASTKTQTWALSEPAGEGPYTVDVSLTANYKVGAIQFKVANADGNAVLTDVALNAAVFGEDWDANYDIDKTDDGLVIIIPTPKNASKAGPDLTAGAKIATLTYELAEGKTSAKIAIENDPKTAGNIGGSLIAVRMSDDSLTTGTLYYGQTVLSVGEAKTIGSAAAEPADLALTATGSSAGVIIDTNKFKSLGYDGVVYGLPDRAAAALTAQNYKAYYETYLTVTNGGTYTITKSPYVSKPASYGTGAIIQVYNSDGTLSKKYVVVIFGDVDGTGSITGLDASKVTAHIASANFTEIQIMAGNVLVLGKGTAEKKAAYLYDLIGLDSSAITADVAITGSSILVSKLATAHNTYNTYYQ